MTNRYRKILCDICDEEGIEYDFLSKDWVMRLAWGEKVRYIVGLKFDNNAHGLGLIVDDKFALQELLRSRQVPTVKSAIFYPETNQFGFARGCNSWRDIYAYFLENDEDVVMKPNVGMCGQDVCRITTKEELGRIWREMLWHYDSINVEPFYHVVQEYRAVMLRNEVKLSYGKCLGEDEWRYNLSQGARAVRINDAKKKQRVEDLAREAARAVGLKFGSVDIIETGDGLLVLEMNSSVTFEKYLKFFPEDYEVVKEIYRVAIKEMFRS